MSTAPTINATLIGAAGAEYTISIPVDMSLVYTSKRLPSLSTMSARLTLDADDVLSISQIETTGGSCTFCGIDGAEVVTQFPGPGAVILNDEVDVGPPQTIVYAACT